MLEYRELVSAAARDGGEWATEECGQRPVYRGVGGYLPVHVRGLDQG